jgi:hypothetical protein
MKLNQVLRMSADVGLVVELQPLGFRVYEADGRLIGSQLPREQVESLIRSRSRKTASEGGQEVGIFSCAFPAF